MDTKGRLLEMANGSYVEADVFRIVEKVREYDSNLRVKYIDPSQSDLTDAPYAIFEVCKDGLERLVFSVWELDDRVLERLEAADNNRHNVLVDMNGHNLRVKEAQNQRYKEKMLEAHDIFRHVLASPKGTYSFPAEGKIVTIDDSGPAKVKLKG